MRVIVAIGCFLLCRVALAQTVYPTNWWVGMKHSTIQVIVRGEGVGKATAVSVNYPGVTVTDWHRATNPNYVFLHLRIAPETKPGTVKIGLSGTGSVDFVVQQRRNGNGTVYAQGVTASDFIYFLMPDRWSNGDPGNDRIPGLRDQSLNRDSMYLRHGGDFQGIIDHLDYLQQLGVTALWMTPVILNDMPDRTEHGYAFTDHYTIDPRLGGPAGYQKLSTELHRRGMKLIQDAVYNHVGSYHWIASDPPEKDWLHQWPVYTQTNYRGEPLMDPHASTADRKLSSDGWFTRQMPDLNQDNPGLAEFLIQHAIWSVESFGVDGWRIDTYMY
ncbi:MAG TPA: alpha-amylase family glycosyl hydrolase, partial [Puia sp.]